MNGRTSKTINKFSASNGFSRKYLKRLWNRTPRTERNELRKLWDGETK